MVYNFSTFSLERCLLHKTHILSCFTSNIIRVAEKTSMQRLEIILLLHHRNNKEVTKVGDLFRCYLFSEEKVE